MWSYDARTYPREARNTYDQKQPSRLESWRPAFMRSTPPQKLNRGQMPPQEESCIDRNDPMRKVDLVLEDPQIATGYIHIMMVGVAVFIVTIIGFIAVCDRWYNYLGFFHIVPLIAPYFGTILNPMLYAGVTVIGLFIGVISLFVGLGKCALEAFLLGSVYLLLNGGVLYMLIQFDEEVHTKWVSFSTAVSSRCGGQQRNQNVGAYRV